MNSLPVAKEKKKLTLLLILRKTTSADCPFTEIVEISPDGSDIRHYGFSSTPGILIGRRDYDVKIECFISNDIRVCYMLANADSRRSRHRHCEEKLPVQCNYKQLNLHRTLRVT